jgi:hypothetical protein
MPTPYNIKLSGVEMRLNIMAGNRISGSLMPPFRLVKKSAVRSPRYPPQKMPTRAPMMAAMKQRPVS